MKQQAISLKLIQCLAASKGLGLIGLTEASPDFHAAKQLGIWQEQGFAAEMQYMKRAPELLSNPQSLLASARNVLMFAVAYDGAPAPNFRTGFGRVARYAWGKDYHGVLKSRLSLFMAELQRKVGYQINHSVFSDAVPFLERSFARRAGLGFIGKNTMLIRPGLGSYFFIAEILLEADIVADSLQVVQQEGSCSSCQRCIDDCPTAAITKPYNIDAGKCISYLSIEKRGAFNLWERRALGEWLFGCDLCQERCPFNHKSLRRERSPDLLEFSSEAGVGGLLDLKQVLNIRTNREFEKRFEGTALLRARRSGLLRNAACVAVNTYAKELLPSLLEVAEQDSSAVVRQHCLWASQELSAFGLERERRVLKGLLEKGSLDKNDEIANECRNLMESIG